MYTSCPHPSSHYPPTAKDSCPASPDLALSQLMALLDPIIYGTPATTLVVQRDPPWRIVAPRFDVHETATEYVLEGEFPGLSDKSKLDIKFTDHKTLLVRGMLEHSPNARVTSGGVLKEAPPVSLRSPDPTMESTQGQSATASTMSADEFVVVLTPSSEKVDLALSPTLVVEKNKNATENENPVSNGGSSRVWVSERAFGSFQRIFSFQGLVNIDNVNASLDSGLLRIVVPKRE